ncbi:hypothetical protein Ac2012v2_005309 [Leucoagaricus gongylophorus]
MSRGIHVVSKNEPIPPNVALVRIPNHAVLSVRSCSLSEYIPIALHGWDAQLGLAFALYSEILRGGSSRWSGYLCSLQPVDLPIFWTCSSPQYRQSNAMRRVETELIDSLLWLRGTGVSKHWNEKNERGQRLLDAIELYYRECVLTILQRPDVRRLLKEEPNLAGFHHAFSLVLSRAFLLDIFHGLAMTPVADAFNHIIQNHVHIQSDFYVCPECGSLRQCPHDDTYDGNFLNPSTDVDHDLLYEMVSNAEILPNEEVFNTYGERLSNAELLMQYGFILDPNDNDVVHFSETEIIRFSASLCDGPVVPPSLSKQGIMSLTESFTTSNLVSIQKPPSTEAALYIDSDGKISVQLWLFIIQILWKDTSFAGSPSSLSETELIDVAMTQSHMENVLYGSRSAGTDEVSDGSNTHLSLWVQVLVNLARIVVRLCEGKGETIGHPQFKNQDFGEILDTIPEDKSRQRLAVFIAMSERSILDSCRFGWIDFIDAFYCSSIK